MASPNSFSSSTSQPSANAAAVTFPPMKLELSDKSQEQAAENWLMSNFAPQESNAHATHAIQTQDDTSTGGLYVNTVMRFHEICQQMHLVPEYKIEIHPHGGFRGTLFVGEMMYTVHGPLQNKRAVKEQLAVQGMPAVKELQLTERLKVDESEDSVNWVGKLQETIAKVNLGKTPMYGFKDEMHGTYSCTVQLPLDLLGPSNTFSSRTEYRTKRAAKSAAAKVAMEALDNSALIPKKEKLTLPNITSQEGSIKCTSESTYIQRLEDLAKDAGLSPPRYKLEPDDASKVSYSGSLFFPETLLAGPENFSTGGPLGRVEGVRGRLSAKEQLAAQVLPEIERKMKERLELVMQAP